MAVDWLGLFVWLAGLVGLVACKKEKDVEGGEHKHEKRNMGCI